jgi:TolB-like protein
MPAPALFLSYARDDAAAARRIAEALRGAGLEVWFDENELTGGDAWDQKIRGQIGECALFLPVISANTQARLEGYFRLEWRLAEQRSHLMAKGKRFLVPVCIDDTREKGAQVPDAFLEVQWTRIGSTDSLAAFCERVKILLCGSEVARVSRPVDPETTDQETRARPKVGRRVPAAAWIGVIAVVAIGSGATFFATRKSGTNAGAGARPPTEARSVAAKPPLDFAVAKSIAVLAFENVGGDKENEYFSEGVPDEIMTQLGKVAGLRLAGRNSSFALRGRPEAEVAQKLNVTHVVSGSVQRVGSQVKITARLVNATDGTQLWQDRFTEEMKDIFAAQEKIAGLIAEKLSLRLNSASRVARIIDPEAQRLVLEGRYFLNRRYEGEQPIMQAEAAYVRAVEVDAQIAEAQAGLAETWMLRALYRGMCGGGSKDGNDLERAMDRAKRALELNAGLAEPHATLGFVLYQEGKFREAEQHFLRAVAANANHALAHHWHGLTLAAMGRLLESLPALERSLNLDPLAPNTLWSGAALLDSVGRFDELLTAAERALTIRPGLVPVIGERAIVYWQMGRTTEAVAAARVITADLAYPVRWWADADAIYVLRLAGFQSEAEIHAERILGNVSAGD